MKPLLITVSEAARLRGVSRWAIHRWLRSGLGHYRRGRSILIDRHSLLSFTPRGPGNPQITPRRTRKAA